ncbi:MAG: glycosyltransferase family 2 protein [Solirubrobacteraceae bacterium]
MAHFSPPASVVIPTRERPGYLAVTLASVAPQAARIHAEVLIVSDGPDPATAEVAARHGARVVSLPVPRGLNAARNAGVAAAGAELIVFLDDDVRAPEGWLDALLDGARSVPEVEVFGGPIHAQLEGGGPRACGREPPPITTLDLGDGDREVPYVWGANMAIRRRSFDRVGPFDEALQGRGDEEEWLRRHRAAGGRVRYLARAGLEHRRTAQDSTVAGLSRAAFALGRTARRNDVRKGEAPPVARELRVLAGCGWHAARRRCAFGIVMGAHCAGRLVEWWRPARATVAAEDFLSGASGQIVGSRAVARAATADALADAVALITLRAPRLRGACARGPQRRVLVLALEHAGAPNLLAAAQAELEGSRHAVEFLRAEVAGRGKFENLNRLLARTDQSGYDWLLVVDDDVAMPAGFLDSFLFLAERFALSLAQPAHRHRSHAAWAVTRRRASSVARQTSFVEIGPVSAFHRRTFEILLPFPELRVGWGLDLHWAAVAREHGWRSGVIDATPVLHRLRPIATSYDRSGAVAEAREFLRERPYLPAAEAARTLATYRGWRHPRAKRR